MNSHQNEAAVTSTSLLAPCPMSAACVSCSIASSGVLSIFSAAASSGASQAAHITAYVALGTAEAQHSKQPPQHASRLAKAGLPSSFLDQITSVTGQPSSVVAGVVSSQQQGSGYWAHPAVGDAALHVMGAVLGGQKELLLPALIGCYAPASELQGGNLICCQLCLKYPSMLALQDRP